MDLRPLMTGAALCAIALASPSFTEAGGLVGKGVVAGLAFSKLGGGTGDLIDARTRTGPAAGGFARIGLGGAFQLQPELLFVAKGATDRVILTDEAGSPVGVATNTFALDYIELPVLVRITIPTVASGRVGLLTGPTFAAKVTSRFHSRIAGVPDQDLGWVTGTDVGWVVGADVDLSPGIGGFLLDARYTHGLTDVRESGSPLDARNRTFTVMAGYGF